MRLVREEVNRIQQENRNREAALGKERKMILGEEKKIDFFPQWKQLQGVVEEDKEEEQYMTVDENWRLYIAVRRRQRDKQEKEEREWGTEIRKEKVEQMIEEETEEEEYYMTIREDGRSYIIVRIRHSQ